MNLYGAMNIFTKITELDKQDTSIIPLFSRSKC